MTSARKKVRALARPTILRSAVGLSAAALFVGCSDERARATSAAVKLAQEWRQSGPARPPLKVLAPSGAIRLYVDASRSMGGFGACTGGAAPVEEIAVWLPTALGVDSVSVFGRGPVVAGIDRTASRVRSGMFCERFFRELNNPDYVLYEQMARDSSDVNIYVTDGVQSDEEGGTIVRTMGLLSRHLQAGRALAFIVFKAPFHGQLWSERTHRMIGAVKVPDRPLYLVVLAPSAGHLKGLLNRMGLPTRPHWAATILLSAEDLACDTEVGSVFPVDLRKQDRWVMVNRSGLGGADVSALLRLKCRLGEGMPVAQLSADLDVQAQSWPEAGFSPSDVPEWVPGATRALASIGEVAAEFSINQRPSFSGRYLNLAVEFRPRIAALAPAVDSLSTENDDSLPSAGRTYRFSTLVRGLVQTLVDDIPAAHRRGSVTIANK